MSDSRVVPFADRNAPEAPRVDRRLAAIMYADAVAYSRLVERDEAWTLRALGEARRRIAASVSLHRGRVVSTPGDAVLADFGSAVDAVRSAAEIQRGFAADDRKSPTGDRLDFRIGLNVGDVVVEGDDLLGDGVNIAARVQSLADVGGISISGTVYDQIRDKLDLVCVDLGRHELKHISRPVRIFKVAMTPEALLDRGQDDIAPTEKPSVLVLPDKPSIAVLPFDNLSGDPAQDYFAEGITGNIINALCQSHWFFVIARNSTFAYKRKPKDIREVSRDLGVRYVVEGSVLADGDVARIAIELSDSSDGHVLWSNHYDCDLDGRFDIQDTITLQIAGSIEPELLAVEAQRSFASSPSHRKARDNIFRAYSLLWRLTKEDSAKGRDYLRRALEIESQASQAFMGLAICGILEIYMGWADSIEETLVEAASNATQAVLLDKNDSWAHLALGFVYLQSQQLDDAIAELKRAIKLNSSFAMAYGCLAQALIFAGDTSDATILVRMAMRISPRDPFMVYWQVALSQIHLLEERYEEGARWARQAIRENPNWPGGYRLLAVCYGLAGRIDEARSALERMLELQPDMSMTYLRHLLPFRNQNDFERYISGLKKAGWDG